MEEGTRKMLVGKSVRAETADGVILAPVDSNEHHHLQSGQLMILSSSLFVVGGGGKCATDECKDRASSSCAQSSSTLLCLSNWNFALSCGGGVGATHCSPTCS